MGSIFLISEQDIAMDESIPLISPMNPTPTESIFLSNIDQTVAFYVETIFFFDGIPAGKTSEMDIVERMKAAVSVDLLVPYYFMAGRLRLNGESNRLELVCNNAGVQFCSAMSRLRLEELGNLSHPNPSFCHLVLKMDKSNNIMEVPLLTVQVTKFKCGGFSIGFASNHSVLDGRSAAEMFQNLASICRGEGLKTHVLNNDRTCIRARVPPQIKYPHEEYTKIPEMTTSFTCPAHLSPPPSLLGLAHSQSYQLFHFTAQMITTLKNKATVKCSSFEALVAHLWQSRSRSVFQDLSATSSVLFAVDIRNKMSPPLPHGFVGNAVVTACASATVADLKEKPLRFCVERVKESIENLNDEYVRSVVDWLEVHRGVPCTSNGNFYVSAWWKLPLHELDFGYGRPIYGGPVVKADTNEFVLLLSDNARGGKGKGEGVNVWISLDQEKMEKFMLHVFDF